MKKFLVLSLLSLFFIQEGMSADGLKGKYELSSSKIDYLVTYLIKKADGFSTAAKGKGECGAKCEFLVAVPVKSFESKDANRDANMLKVTRAEKNPLVVAHIFTPVELKTPTFKADMEIELGGVKHLYKEVPFNFTQKGNDFHVDGKVDVLLSQHNIERPSLIGVEIKDIVPITISAEWKKSN